jgi:hypothetical protein
VVVDGIERRLMLLAALFSLEKLVHFFQILLFGPGGLERFFTSALLIPAYVATAVALAVNITPAWLFSFI